MEKKVFLEIPLNRIGLYSLAENIAARDEGNFKIYEFSYDDEMLLLPLFHQFNEVFNICIDDYEEDILMVKQLSEAIKITKCFWEKATDSETKDNALKVLEALEFAKKLKMPIEFVF